MNFDDTWININLLLMIINNSVYPCSLQTNVSCIMNIVIEHLELDISLLTQLNDFQALIIESLRLLHHWLVEIKVNKKTQSRSVTITCRTCDADFRALNKQ